eukprot:4260280-Pyramimonas_sp.AAC.1
MSPSIWEPGDARTPSPVSRCMLCAISWIRFVRAARCGMWSYRSVFFWYSWFLLGYAAGSDRFR